MGQTKEGKVDVFYELCFAYLPLYSADICKVLFLKQDNHSQQLKGIQDWKDMENIPHQRMSNISSLPPNHAAIR